MLSPGTMIDDKYEVVGQVGTGGFGTVYQAHQKGLDRSVAVKVFGGQGFVDSQDAARFEQEAKAISLLSHRNIVGFRGYGIWQETPYMVMEYLSGSSLEVALSKGHPLEVRTAIQIMLQLCDALTCAHAHGIIHRDLKPSNVFLSEGGSNSSLVRVIDFGLARLLTPDVVARQRLTAAGTAIGSCQYMSPEQCLGEEVDARTDIYSAGCIFYYCLTGRPAYDGDNPITIMHQHVNGAVPRLTSDAAFLEQTAALQAIVDRAMCKNREGRYACAADMAADLMAVVKELPVGGFNLSHNSKPSFKLNRKLLGALGALMVVFFGFLLYDWSNSSQAPPAMTFNTGVKVDDVDRERQLELLFRANKSMIDGNLPQALVAYRDIASDDHVVPQLRLRALEGVAQVYSRQRNFSEAIKNLKLALQFATQLDGTFAPNTVAFRRELIDLHIIAGNLRDARELLVREIENEQDTTPAQAASKQDLQHRLLLLDEVLHRGASTVQP